MPQPTASSVYIDELITSMSIAYVQDEKSHFGRSIFGVVPVELQTSKYPVFTKADFSRDGFVKRTPGTRPPRTGFNMSTTQYSCVQYNLAAQLPDEVRKNFRARPDADKYIAMMLSEQAMIREDRLFASTFLTTSVWGTDYTGVSSGENNTSTFRQWNDSASDPLLALTAGKRQVQKTIGREANFVAFGPTVYDALCIHPDIVGSLPSDAMKIVGKDVLSKLLGLEVFVMDAVYNSAVEGQTASMAHIAGACCLLGYRSPNPAIAEPSCGYTFHWDQFGAGVASSGAVAIEKFREDQEHADVSAAYIALDQKVTASDAAVFYTSIVA